MQVTWHYLMSPMWNHKRLPSKVLKRCQNLFIFWHSIAKGAARLIVELTKSVFGQAG